MGGGQLVQGVHRGQFSGIVQFSQLRGGPGDVVDGYG